MARMAFCRIMGPNPPSITDGDAGTVLGNPQGLFSIVPDAICTLPPGTGNPVWDGKTVVLSAQTNKTFQSRPSAAPVGGLEVFQRSGNFATVEFNGAIMIFAVIDLYDPTPAAS
jgi:hypothetical protein